MLESWEMRISTAKLLLDRRISSMVNLENDGFLT
jgi:hypothetical protein